MVLETLEIPVSLNAPEFLLRRSALAINHFHTGDYECNKFEEGKLVAKYPEKDKTLQEAHTNLRMSRWVTLLVDINENGDWTNLRVKEALCSKQLSK